MKCLLGGLVIVLLIAGAVSAQDWIYLSNGQKLTIAGTGATLEASSITVGSGTTFDYGNRLYISDGGYVNCLGSMDVRGTWTTGVPSYDWLYSYVSIIGAGSALDIGGDLTVKSGIDDGNYTGVGDASVIQSYMKISGDAEVSVAGDIAIMGLSYMNISSGGHLSIGSDLTSSEGALNIASNGLLEMQLGEHTRGTRLYVTGDSYLDGTLDITLYGQYSPSYGDSFDLFNWDGEVSGEFTSITTSALTGDLEWDTSELYTTGTLSVIPEPNVLALVGIFGGGFVFVRRFVPAV